MGSPFLPRQITAEEEEQNAQYTVDGVGSQLTGCEVGGGTSKQAKTRDANGAEHQPGPRHEGPTMVLFLAMHSGAGIEDHDRTDGCHEHQVPHAAEQRDKGIHEASPGGGSQQRYWVGACSESADTLRGQAWQFCAEHFRLHTVTGRQ